MVQLDLERDDPNFVEDLKESHSVVFRAAQWLSFQGWKVTINPLRIRPTIDEMFEYSDGGDIEIAERIEVKLRKIAFTGRDDFPYRTIIVDVAHTWEKANPKPLMYILFNESMTHAALVKRSSAPHWSRIERFDRQKNRTRTFLECPVEYVEFRAIEAA